MLSVDEGEEVFFDATDHFLSEVVNENLEYDIWLKEPPSVKERRESFLSRMGFMENSLHYQSELDLERCTASIPVVSTYESSSYHKLLSQRRESNSEANCSTDYSDHDWLGDISIQTHQEFYEKNGSVPEEGSSRDNNKKKKKKKVTRWWRHFKQMMKKTECSRVTTGRKLLVQGGVTRLRTVQNRKKCVECSAIYTGQEFHAHDGIIRTMKFSPDGKYIASGGEDGVVCIWRVSLIDGSCKGKECSFGSHEKLSLTNTIIPEKIFHIEEEPVHKFLGHSSDVLDLAWSSSNHLLSSSMDKTVRFWHVGSDKCLDVFHHSSCVTCIQFNPTNENYFISGSIDGKVRIWGVSTRRVEDWVNIRDVVTAVCYQPNGEGFVIGSVSGTCRFYESLSNEFFLNAEINILGRKRSTGSGITGIQFLKDSSQRMMVTSEDSKIRILDGLEVVCKYRGLTKSGSQMSASSTSSGNHIVSVGEDSRVYVWNYDNLSIKRSKETKSLRSCEHFLFQGVSVALPWSNFTAEPNTSIHGSSNSSSTQYHQESSSRTLDSDCFSLANWFSLDGSSRAITWPEERLPFCAFDNHLHHHHHQEYKKDDRYSSGVLPTTWGLVFVTGNWDGKIKTFHNYGLPVKV